jgi:hypothetical protein
MATSFDGNAFNGINVIRWQRHSMAMPSMAMLSNHVEEIKPFSS